MKQLHLFKSNESDHPKRKKSKSIEEIIDEANPLLGPESKPVGYKQYIQSEDWKNKRRYAIYKSKGVCQRCKKQKKLEVHHRHYDTLYRERLNDVEVLCIFCHPKADSERENFSAYATWAYKKYGERFDLDSEWLQNEFDEWYQDKEQEDDFW